MKNTSATEQNDIMNVMLLITDDFTFISSPFIYSVIKNNKWAKEIHFYILTNNLSKTNRSTLRSLIESLNAKVDFVDVDVSIFEGLKVSTQYPLLLYCKMLPHKYLPKNIDKAIFFDVDMIMDGSFEELYKIDLQDNYFAACYGINALRWHLQNPGKDGGVEENYINSGNMVFNLKKYRDDKIDLKFYLKLLNNTQQTLYEEFFINNMMYGSIMHLMPFDYNYNVGARGLYKDYCKANDLEAKKLLIHYMPFKNDSPIIKPWNAYEYFYENKKNDVFDSELYELYKIWWDYALELPASIISGIISYVSNSKVLKRLNDTVVDRNKWKVYADTFKHIINYNLTDRNNPNCLENYMFNKGYKSIAIYADSEITKILTSILNNSKIKIEYILEDTEVKGFKTLPRKTTTLPTVDLLLIADMINLKTVEEKLAKQKYPFKIESASKFIKSIK